MRNGVAALLVTVTGAGSALAQTAAPAGIVGTYNVVSSEQTGYLFYDPSGLMAVVGVNRLTLFPPSTTPGRQGSLAWEALPSTSSSR